jgi:predicted ABC-type ATPase
MPFVAMIAGPNGSGKTTLTTFIKERGFDLGRYINPDEIAKGLAGSYDERVRAAQNAAVIARADCIVRGVSFTFETVMSHPSKLEVLKSATEAGFETILYFVGTKSAALNVERVRQRVDMGGHDVPTDKIIQRYERSIALLPEALSIASRAFVFDNSNDRGLVLGASKRTQAGRPEYDLKPAAPNWIRSALLAASHAEF